MPFEPASEKEWAECLTVAQLIRLLQTIEDASLPVCIDNTHPKSQHLSTGILAQVVQYKGMVLLVRLENKGKY